MAVRNTINPIELTSIDSAGFNGTYMLLSAASGISQPCVIFRIVNNSDVGILVSYDGATDHDFVPATSTLQINAQSNSNPSSMMANLAKGTKVWVQGDMGDGLVYFSAYYVPQGI